MTYKNKIQHKLKVYEGRRIAMKAKYPGHNIGNKARNLNVKIYCMKQQLKRFELMEQKMYVADCLVSEFMGCTRLRFSIRDRKLKRNYYLGRQIFFKYCLENLGIRGNYLSEYVGAAVPSYAAKKRMYFMRCDQNERNKKLYANFLQFAKEYREDELKGVDSIPLVPKRIEALKQVA